MAMGRSWLLMPLIIVALYLCCLFICFWILQGTLRDLSKGGRNVPIDQIEPVCTITKSWNPFVKLILQLMDLLFLKCPNIFKFWILRWGKTEFCSAVIALLLIGNPKYKTTVIALGCHGLFFAILHGIVLWLWDACGSWYFLH